MIAYETWDRPPAPEFPRFWYAMLDECSLLGSGVVPDWEERLTGHFAREMEAGRMQWFVAQADGRIAGTAAAILGGGGSYIFKDPSATLAGIFVLPEYRRRGIARELTARAIDWCTLRAVKTIRLHASNAGRPLYESLGFVTATENMRLDLR